MNLCRFKKEVTEAELLLRINLNAIENALFTTGEGLIDDEKEKNSTELNFEDFMQMMLHRLETDLGISKLIAQFCASNIDLAEELEKPASGNSIVENILDTSNMYLLAIGYYLDNTLHFLRKVDNGAEVRNTDDYLTLEEKLEYMLEKISYFNTIALNIRNFVSDEEEISSSGKLIGGNITSTNDNNFSWRNHK